MHADRGRELIQTEQRKRKRGIDCALRDGALEGSGGASTEELCREAKAESEEEAHARRLHSG